MKLFSRNVDNNILYDMWTRPHHTNLLNILLLNIDDLVRVSELHLESVAVLEATNNDIM